jgi:hypothetical protein
MKATLKYSMLLNVVLLGCLIFAAVEGRKVTSESIPPVQSEPKPSVTEVAAPAPQVLPQVEPQPFSWSQLESADYRTYIKNLRGIGCPEPTLRAIVTADVDRLYTAKNQELEQKLTALENGSWTERLASADARQDLEAAMQKLPGEEDAEIADLLGLKPAPVVAADDSSPPPRSWRNQNQPQTDAPVSMPLVFQNIDFTTLNLNDEQIQAIKNLRQSFLNQVGGTNQDPQDPAYLARWQKAQPEMDSMLRAMIGGPLYYKYQAAVENQASAAQ